MEGERGTIFDCKIDFTTVFDFYVLIAFEKKTNILRFCCRFVSKDHRALEYREQT